MSKTSTCPQCGAEVKFLSTLSLWLVCPYCDSTLVRTDLDLKSLGKMSDLRPDISPLQVGATGTYKNRPFAVAGRVRNCWSDGEWNEWFIVFSKFSQGNPSTGWIAEAQGEWMLSYAVELKDEQRSTLLSSLRGSLNKPSPGQSLTLQSTVFTLTDIREIVCEGSEGELPFSCPRGRRSTVLDFRSQEGRFASIDLTADEELLLHTGEYADFAAFNFKNLRTLHDW